MNLKRLITTAAIAGGLGINLGFSQSKTCAEISKGTPAAAYCSQIQKVIAAAGDSRSDAAAELAQFFTDTDHLPSALHYSMFSALFHQAEGTRTDMQSGAPASANGTTNLVSLPGAADFLSVAVGTGAVTETTSGTTTTVGANVGQVLGYFSDGAKFDYSLHGIPVLQNIDATISIANFPGSGTSVPVTTSGSSTSGNATLPSTAVAVTGATARYQLFNKFDPHSPQFKTAFLQYVNTHQQAISKAYSDEGAAINKLLQDNFVQAANDHTTLDIARQQFAAASTVEDLVNLFNAYFIKVLQTAQKNPSFNSDLSGAVAAMSEALNEYRNSVNSAKGIPALTIEYTYTSSPNEPITHNVRLIAGMQSQGGMMLTFNSAGTFYQSQPTGTTMGHFRDFQVAAQGDIPIGFGSGNHAADLSFAGYGQYQSNPSLLTVSASDLPNGFPTNAPALVAGTQGWLGIGQIKLDIKNSSGVEFVPLSWKWSSREDVFTKSQGGFQFGLSYNISSLKQLIGMQ